MNKVVDWLLEDTQPASKYRTLVDVLGYSRGDSQVKSAKSEIPKRGWAAEILATQRPEGFWEGSDSLYVPKYTATNWKAIVLSELGLTKRESRIIRTADLFFERWLDEKNTENIFRDEVCIVGNAARMMINFGYEEDPRVKKLFERLIEIQKDDGGWHCFDSKEGTLDCWEALAAFAALTPSKRTRKIKRSIELGVEFYLSRELLKEGKKYLPWYRLHYPNHYYYDFLIGLDVLTKLGYGKDKRLGLATSILKKKRRPDGTWELDSVHPDLGRGANYYLRHKAKYFAIEHERQPSKWITLKALSVLKRIKDQS